LWHRGDKDSVPQDHFADVENIAFIESGFRTRDGIDPFTNPRNDGTRSVARMYTFNTKDFDGLITLEVPSGNFYHVNPATNAATFLVNVPGATDFTMAIGNGRAYINPFIPGGSLASFLHVYDPVAGPPARPAGGEPPKNVDGALSASNSGAGNVEAGIHIFGVVYETKSGFRTQIGPETLPTVTASGTNSVLLSNIPISPNPTPPPAANPNVVARHIVASKAIDPTLYTGNTRGYQLFFVPGGTINNNSTTSWTVNFFDSQLLESADGLLDIASQVPNGTGVTIYHNRLVITSPRAIGDPDTGGINKARVSNAGEFEAFSNLDGFLQVQDDGLGLLNAQEYRDILYMFKINETVAFTDNGDVPTSWPATVIDEGLGAGTHGVVYIDTRQGMSSEYLLLENYSGVFMFNGTFIRPELSYKISDLWLTFSQAEIAQAVEFYNDVLHQFIVLNFPSEKLLLIGDYANGMTPEAIRWTRWIYTVTPTTITLFDKSNKLLIGSQNSGDNSHDGIYMVDTTKVNDTIFQSDVATSVVIVPHSVELYLLGDAG